MPLHPSWADITIRLLLTVVAGVAIGVNRESRGRPAGLRTTVLIGLASAVAMIQTNILLSTGGRVASSFANIDVMRLPLGILTGVGFIGGGAILRRGDMVLGITTAATMWVMAVIGLCFGGGQLALGAIATALTVLTLWGLKLVDLHVPRAQHAFLVISTGRDDRSAPDLDRLLAPKRARAELQQRSVSDDGQRVDYEYMIRWSGPEVAGPPMELFEEIDHAFTVRSVEFHWE